MFIPNIRMRVTQVYDFCTQNPKAILLAHTIISSSLLITACAVDSSSAIKAVTISVTSVSLAIDLIASIALFCPVRREDMHEENDLPFIAMV